MFNYTYRNHFRFGYEGAEDFSFRKDLNQVFRAHLGPCSELHLSWKESNQKAARLIRESYSGDIWILYSGGCDSEICLQSFLTEKIPVRVATLRLAKGLNEHDISFARTFCQQQGLKQEIFDLDIEDFWNSEKLNDLVDPIQCVGPHLAPTLWLADQLEGLPVIAQGEPHLIKEVDVDYVPGESPYLSSPWHYVENERLCSLYRHFILKKRAAIPGFFQYLPEQIYALLKRNSVIQDLVQNKVIGKLGTRSSKYRIVSEEYGHLTPRPKYHGFENVEELHSVHRQRLALKYPASDQNFLWEYSDLVRHFESGVRS